MSHVLDFKDFGFKLAVIEILMYEKEILKPAIDSCEMLKKARNVSDDEARDIIEDIAYDIIPEVLTYCQNLTITADMVEDIEEIYMCGGSEIYHQLMPYWDGEGDEFNVNSAVDVDLLPNLKKINLLCKEKSLFDEFEKKGIEADWI